MTRREIKIKAKNDMTNNYGRAILTSILLSLTLMGSAFLGIAGIIVAYGAVKCCYAAFYVDVANHDIKGVDSTYRGYAQFGKALLISLVYIAIYIGLAASGGIMFACFSRLANPSGLSLFMSVLIFILFLLGAAAIVALVFVLIKLKFVFYVMNDKTDLKTADCLKESWKLTKRHFWQIVVFELSFIGWKLLSVITLGALSLYVTPYYKTSVANFYLSLVESQTSAETPAEASTENETNNA